MTNCLSDSGGLVEGIVVFIVAFCMTRLVIMVLDQRLKIKELEQKIELIEQSEERWKQLYWSFKSKDSNDILAKPYIIKIVKYAMKHAHPDNGGNAEDFIRFQKCYEELTMK